MVHEAPLLPSSAGSLLTIRRWSTGNVGGAGYGPGGGWGKQRVKYWSNLITLVTVHARSFPTDVNRFEDLPLLLPGFLVEDRHSLPVYLVAGVYYVFCYSRVVFGELSYRFLVLPQTCG